MQIAAGVGTALGFLVGIFAHEVVTHRVADRLGDKTPRLMGRMVVHPKAHYDVLGSVVLPAIFVISAIFSGYPVPPFGWGKRHSLNVRMLRAPKRDTIIVSLSGPAATAILAAAAGIAAPRTNSPQAATILLFFALVCTGLTVFELLPIPGRDGARILCVFLSPSAAQKMEELAQYEILFLLVLFMFLPGVANGIFEAGCRGIARLCTVG